MPGQSWDSAGQLTTGPTELVAADLNISMKRKLHFLCCAVLAVCGSAFIGVMQTFDEFGSHNEFFLKVRPSFKVFFPNPYLTYFDEPEKELSKRRDANFDWLPGTVELSDYLAYCRAKYGISREDSIDARKQCKAVDEDLH